MTAAPGAPAAEAPATALDPVEATLLEARLAQVPTEMGAVLRASAFSPNIKERMDASCALFDRDGRLLAQAEHIPVHLGALPLAVQAVRDRDWAPGDQVLFNDPKVAGTHLPDLTLVAPVFAGDDGDAGGGAAADRDSGGDDGRGGDVGADANAAGTLLGFVANKAHHADVGGSAPGSMPADSRSLAEEGLVLPPVRLLAGGEENPDVVATVLANTRTPEERIGDLRAQVGANRLGARRFLELWARGPDLADRAAALLDRSEARMRAAVAELPAGTHRGSDVLEAPDGDRPAIEAAVTVDPDAGSVRVDFAGTAPELDGNLNAPLGVTHAAVHFVLRALTDPEVPRNAGSLRPLGIDVPDGCLLNPSRGRAVAGGNVETSQRIVDVLLDALRDPMDLPAQSQGTMNNVLVGSPGGPGTPAFSYYETVGGGAGAGPEGPGTDGVHTHMTNTENTPVEVLETAYPLRVRTYALRGGSGGAGRHRGGRGLRRAIEALAPCTASLLTERRAVAPRGAAGGGDGAPGRNLLVRDGEERALPAKAAVELAPGDVLVVETPGGGGWGAPDADDGA